MPRPRRSFRFVTQSLTTLLTLTACAALCACAAREPRDPQSDSSSSTQAIPAADGTGLQLITWTLDNSAALAPLITPNPTADSPPLPAVAPRTLEAWQQNGMLIARVRQADLLALSKSMTFTTQPQQQLLAFSSQRSEALRGNATAYDTLRLGADTMPLRNAATRLLIRAWPVPAVTTPASVQTTNLPAAVQVELTPQVLSLTRPRRTSLEAVDNSPEAQGVILARLIFETTLQPGEALVIFPARAPAPSKPALARTDTEKPSVPPPPPPPKSRRNTAAKSDDAPTDATATTQSPAIDPLVIDAEEAGPALPTAESLPTFGDALLTDILSLPSQGERRLLIIIPRAPQSYSLLRPQ